MTTTQLQKEANKAPKYILKMEGLPLYVSSNQGISGVQLVAIPKKAMQYSVGFDNEKMKVVIWNTIAQRQMNNKEVKFEVVYI